MRNAGMSFISFIKKDMDFINYLIGVLKSTYPDAKVVLLESPFSGYVDDPKLAVFTRFINRYAHFAKRNDVYIGPTIAKFLGQRVIFVVPEFGPATISELKLARTHVQLFLGFHDDFVPHAVIGNGVPAPHYMDHMELDPENEYLKTLYFRMKGQRCSPVPYDLSVHGKAQTIAGLVAADLGTLPSAAVA